MYLGLIRSIYKTLFWYKIGQATDKSDDKYKIWFYISLKQSWTFHAKIKLQSRLSDCVSETESRFSFKFSPEETIWMKRKTRLGIKCLGSIIKTQNNYIKVTNCAIYIIFVCLLTHSHSWDSHLLTLLMLLSEISIQDWSVVLW